jgi:hypothetical protein
MKTIPTVELNAVAGGHQSPFGPGDLLSNLGDDLGYEMDKRERQAKRKLGAPVEIRPRPSAKLPMRLR